MILNEIVFRIGVDKVLHFLVGGYIMAFVMLLCSSISGKLDGHTLACSASGLVLVFVLSVLKESLDQKFSWPDVLAGTLGALSIYVPGLLIWFFNFKNE